MQMLGGESLKHELNRCAAWLAQDDGKWKNVSAPKAVVEDMMPMDMTCGSAWGWRYASLA